jgi:transglutaminase-like putative cysteine protease
MTSELRPGNEYTATVYDPKPSAEEMQSAGTAFGAAARRYVTFDLPSRPGVEAPFWRHSGPASIASQLSGTPYVGMYGLARRITSGASTPYEAARRIERYLRDHYAYRQNVPNHSDPLPAFLSVDRAGYCQQFSGTMALMLRMLGVPSRVSTGFAPGGRDPERNNFLVDDTDAHDWVEVFFPRIGWVTFEPTPAAAPAATQLDDNALGVTKSEPSSNGGDTSPVPDQRGAEAQPVRPSSSGSPHGGGGGSGGPTALALGGAAGGLALTALAIYGFRRRRRGLMEPDALARAELDELDSALERIGTPLPTGTTLLEAEAKLGELAGPDAAGYAAQLRNGRYRDPGAGPPEVHERRALRRALLRATGRRSLLRVLIAVPPGGPRPNPRMGRGASTSSRWARLRHRPSAASGAAPGSG